MYEQLLKELAEAGFGPGQLLDGLQAVKEDKVKLSYTAFHQFEDFLQAGQEMFHGKS